MNEKDLYQTIKDYGKTAIPMHMPGHKRNTALLGTDLPYDGDITEIDGFDNLHDLENGGVLKNIAQRAAVLYHARCAFPLVNGSTGGILAAIRALTRYGDTILIARNCHKSVYHAIELCGLSHVSLLPAVDQSTGIYGSITPASVEKSLTTYPEIRTVVVTSPTYEGIVSDVHAIAEIAHRHGARLIVDAAHGAHLGFSESFPPFPTSADVVVTSLHKTLPSLTQTALALVYTDDPSVASALARELAVFETSSPSYVLLASIDRCISLLEEQASTLFSAYEKRLLSFYEAARSLRTMTVLRGNAPEFFGFDTGKLVILSRVLSGSSLADSLRKRHNIEVEMAYTDYVICMTSIADTDESLDRLLAALKAIDDALGSMTRTPSVGKCYIEKLPKRSMTIAEALALPDEPLRVGETARRYAWVYPPGIPLVVPGEEVTAETSELFHALTASGLHIRIGR